MKKITLLIFIFLISACTKPVTEDEIASIKQEIEKHYIQKGFEEIKVSLIRESDFKLTGNATFKKYYLVSQPKPRSPRNFDEALMGALFAGLLPPEKEKPPEKRFNEFLVVCNVNMDQKTRKMVWTCKE